MQLPPDPSPDNFAEVAGMIAGSAPPVWLNESLADVSSTLWLNTNIDIVAPTRREMKNRLETVHAAACLLTRELNDGNVAEFLSLAGLGRIEGLHRFQRNLDILSDCAQKAAKAPEISTSDGKAKPGRGRALPAGGFTSHVYCAAVIAEAWRYIRGRYPAPRTLKAQEAAALFWQLSGGQRNGQSNVACESWRPHLSTVVKTTVSGPLENFRNEIRRQFVEAQHMHQLITAENATENSAI